MKRIHRTSGRDRVASRPVRERAWPVVENYGQVLKTGRAHASSTVAKTLTGVLSELAM